MIDVHHHLIWGVDDGPPDLETSLAMAQMAIEDGITHVVCTPHASNQYPFNASIIEERYADLRARLDGQLQLSLACDFHLTADNIAEACANFPRYSIDGKGYLMIEFASEVIPPVMDQALFQLSAAGYKLIVTHPERYMAVLRKPQMIANWMRAGYMIQITASSFYGRFGKAAEILARELLERNWIHFVATDAHNLAGRAPKLKRTYDIIAALTDEENARRLCLTNPRAALEGKPWPAQPEPLGLWEGKPLRFDLRTNSQAKPGDAKNAGRNSAATAAPRRSLWQRLFGR